MKTKTFPNLTPLIATSLLTAALTLPEADAAVAMSPATTGIFDIADGKPTFGDVAFSAPTSRGNDGIDGAANAGNWTHADYPTSATPYPGQAGVAPNPYWEVDLQGSFNLTSFVVSDRAGCCPDNRLNGSTVTLFGAGGSTVASQVLTVAPNDFGTVMSFDNGGAGFAGVERVRIDGVGQYFQFSEFDAFSMVTLPGAPINWALGTGAGYFDGAGNSVATWGGLPASNINDGVPSTISHALDIAAGGFYAQVDLGQEIMIDNISLTGRIGCCPDRLENYTVEFRDANGVLVHTMTNAGQTTTAQIFDVIGSFGGNGPSAQFVRVVNTGNNQYGPQIGEIEVFGVIPEPSSTLLALAGSALLLRRRRK